MSFNDQDCNNSDPTWEALPPRKNRRRRRRGDDDEDVDNEASMPTISPTNVNEVEDSSMVTHMTTAQLAAARIAENIAARAKVNRTQTTLESQDGCAGEFYEYLDHTADVQCHAWGATMVQAFQNMAECMLNYMTDIKLIHEDPEETITMTVSGNDIQSLLYNYMNELLFKFITDNYCAVRVVINDFDREKFTINATLYGDIYDSSKHSCGTEIKAITYSNMQIHEKPDRVDLFVIVDI